MTATQNYLRDGAAIYAKSFAIIRAEADLTRFSKLEERVAVRIIHACGMVDVASEIAFSTDFATRGSAALATSRNSSKTASPCQRSWRCTSRSSSG